MYPMSDPDSHVRWQDKFPSVCTYSVFRKDGPVKWLITEEELLDIYDLELGIQADLKHFWKKNNARSTRSYTDQVPVKVIRSVGMRIVKGITTSDIRSEHSDNQDCDSIDSETTIRITNCRGEMEESMCSKKPLDFSDDELIAAELWIDDKLKYQT